ncbi:MAG: hypothetical protein HC806_09865 [Anaerolineae bacterium]|nr:hypothetical protein [Anaerolineae bacterium]
MANFSARDSGVSQSFQLRMAWMIWVGRLIVVMELFYCLAIKKRRTDFSVRRFRVKKISF